MVRTGDRLADVLEVQQLLGGEQVALLDRVADTGPLFVVDAQRGEPVAQALRGLLAVSRQQVADRGEGGADLAEVAASWVGAGQQRGELAI